MIAENKNIGRWNLLIATFSILFVFIVFALFVIYWVKPFSLMENGMTSAGQYGDSFGILNSIFSGLGFSVLIVTLIYQQTQIKRQSLKDNYEVDERRSLFNLHSFEEANVKAMDLLKDNNNDRATWIRAARLLGHASVLAKGITIENHLRVYEYKSLEYRTFFRELLEGKPAGFFYGADYRHLSLEVSAKLSTLSYEKDGRTIHGNSILSESSIFAVVSAAEWPDHFIDPIVEKFTAENIDKKTFFYNGLRKFLEHNREWISYNGELKKRSFNDLS